MVELTLPGDRHHDAPLVFKLPTLEAFAASANRLLKFEFPVTRNLQVYERLIKSSPVSARLSKKTLDDLPVPAVEYLYVALWQEFLKGVSQNKVADEWLSLLLLAEEVLEFNLDALVAQDIYWLGLKETAGLHSYYYTGALNRENLIRLLADPQYRTDFLEALATAAPKGGKEATVPIQLAYMACRRLTNPLPWNALLSQLKEADWQRFPRLARLNALRQLMEKEGFFKMPVQPAELPQVLDRLQALLLGPSAEAVAARFKIPRPVRELIIVEGETEKLLLPIFAESMKVDFNALGIFILPAGGKNHVMALYKQFSEIIEAPIFVVLDGDATEVALDLQPVLREPDCVYQISEGEFEDTYDLKLILKTINQHYQPYPEVTPQTFKTEAAAGQGRVQILKSIWQSYGLGSFDKVEFAGKLAEMIQPNMRPPDATRLMLETILKVRQGK